MTGQVATPLSFRRIADIPFGTYMAALDSWQLTRHDGELRLGHSLLRGPIKRDARTGTCRIEIRLARGPLRPPVRMRLYIDPWSPTATALELIPCQRVRRSAAYFAAGHRLLDALTPTPPVRVPAQQQLDQEDLRAAVSVGARLTAAHSWYKAPSDHGPDSALTADRGVARLRRASDVEVT